ncbi:hypothetical protein PDG61_01335 [Mycolicibacterium sp. BiH015]|uniref:hypothetical protein n=1 Tax=Mycolicibacterium sp. BiH015 TaxID=3018808 RepID=UPI0022DF64E6|nr:hypothetical protein [Mycolicibacterium sp. BiH015]MDA2889544.1 hypothetical protein [Mycolicibacterium sp. BiH015]
MLRRTFWTLLVILAAAGCTVFRGAMDIDYNDQRLNGGLESVLHTGQPARLSDLTSWEWDEVHLFHEFSEREFIQTTVGEPVIKADFYGSKASLLVFENNGTPVKAVGISGDYLRGAHHEVTWNSDVIARPLGKGFVELTLPR